MKVDFQEFTTEIDELIEFLTSETWHFHGVQHPKPEKIMGSYRDHYYSGEEAKTFWILVDGNKRAGFIRVFDLMDRTPLFDIRLSSKYRGMGIGKTALLWLTQYLFTHYTQILRIEGHTRHDNYAMRTLFHKCGYVKEAYHRRAWPSEDGNLYDSTGYAIIREDWETQKTTPVDWHDFAY